jgi:hypothetical protein
MKRAFSLAEVVVTLGLSSLVLLALAMLMRSGTRQFELSSGQVFLGQKSRLAVEDTLSFAASAVRPLSESAQLLYSPTPGCSESLSAYPNIYTLDFATCCDFLHPEFSQSPEAVPGYLNRRSGGRHLYRIQFDPDTQKLWLRRLETGGWVDPARPPLLLAAQLRHVSFRAVGESIQMSVQSATVDERGEAHGGLQISDGRRSLQPGDGNRQARQMRLFTVVTLPSRTLR